MLHFDFTSKPVPASRREESPPCTMHVIKEVVEFMVNAGPETCVALSTSEANQFRQIAFGMGHRTRLGGSAGSGRRWVWLVPELTLPPHCRRTPATIPSLTMLHFPTPIPEQHPALLALRAANKERVQAIIDEHLPASDPRTLFLRGVCERIAYEDFYTWPGGTPKTHHAWYGGLVDHTLEVLSLALGMAVDSRIDRAVLITATLWHDVAKIYDYEQVAGRWVTTDYRHKVRHLSGSTILFDRAWCAQEAAAAVEPDLTSTLGMDYQSIQHAILAHHGRQEWGSPVTPQTREALILHSADYYSSQHPRPMSEVSRALISAVVEEPNVVQMPLGTGGQVMKLGYEPKWVNPPG